jgi:probable rRNA maturation factor
MYEVCLGRRFLGKTPSGRGLSKHSSCTFALVPDRDVALASAPCKMILIDPPRSTIAARREPLNKQALARFAKLAIKAAGSSGSVSVLLTCDERIRELNREFRGKNSPTDVLSFPPIAWELEGGNRRRSAGDLAISIETAARQAENLGHSLATEVKVLILHGALHLAGFNHEADGGEMARAEVGLRKRFGLPSGLIERTSSEETGPLARPAMAKRKFKALATTQENARRKAARGRA